MKRWTRIKYQPNLPLKDGNYVTCGKEHRELAREAAREGMVLMKNEGGLLPLRPNSRLALFGKGCIDYVKGGGGSGEVAVEKSINLYDGLKQQADTVSVYEPLCDFYKENVASQYNSGMVPGMIVEPRLPAELLHDARKFTDTALICISRFSGEGWDRSDITYFDGENPWETENKMPQLVAKVYPEGDFYLTKEEKEMLREVKENFPKIIVVLNIGGVIDSAWFKDDGMAVETFRKIGCHGKIGITLDYFPADAASDRKEDRLAAVLDRESHLGWFADPIFKGHYPGMMWKHYHEKGVVMPMVTER